MSGIVVRQEDAAAPAAGSRIVDQAGTGSGQTEAARRFPVDRF